MIHNIFVIHDSKAQAYLPPFIMHQKEMAKRLFSDAINDKNTQFYNHPEDYTLFFIGLYDDNTAQISTEKTPKSLGLGIEFVRIEEQSNQTEFDLQKSKSQK